MLAYDNARLPQALIAAAPGLGDDDLVAEGCARSTGTPDERRIGDPFVRLVGHESALAATPHPGRAMSSRSTPRRSWRPRSRPSSGTG